MNLHITIMCFLSKIVGCWIKSLCTIFVFSLEKGIQKLLNQNQELTVKLAVMSFLLESNILSSSEVKLFKYEILNVISEPALCHV